MDYSIGNKVSLKVPQPYLKTSDAIPMLRPSDIVGLDEVGEIVGIRLNDIVEVKFRRGIFLIPTSNLVMKK